MTITRSHPLSWFPQSRSDCVDSTPVFPGAMASLSNLIPDPSTKDIWQCRPASILLVDTSLKGGAFSSAFSSAFNVGLSGVGAFISLLKVVGTRAYGMISSSSFPGFDIPFSYNIVTGTLDTISGVTSSNIPVSPPSSGAWTPPTADVIGTLLVITHPGFNTTNGYFGWIDISNPAAPVWHSGNTATNALAAVPVAVKQFNGRAWYLVNPATGQPGAYYSDALAATTITNGTQILTFDDNIPLTALGQLPLANQLGGVIQALIVFKGVTNCYQVTGDATSTSNPLSKNSLNVATGTLAPNSICTTPKGLAFIAPDGIRIIDFNANVSDPIGSAGSGVTIPFIFSVVPSRVAAACNLGVIRISTQNGNVAGNPNQEYWYDMTRQVWSGSHTFPASLIQPYSNTFIMTPVGVKNKIFQSDAVQSATSTFIENGNAMSFGYTTAMLPNTGQIATNFVSEMTIDMALAAGGSYSVLALGMQGSVLDSVVVSGPGSTGAVWGSFTWGAATWGAGVSQITPTNINWTQPLVVEQFSIQVTGLCAQSLKFGKFYMRYSVLGYLAQTAA